MILALVARSFQSWILTAASAGVSLDAVTGSQLQALASNNMLNTIGASPLQARKIASEIANVSGAAAGGGMNMAQKPPVSPEIKDLEKADPIVPPAGAVAYANPAAMAYQAPPMAYTAPSAATAAAHGNFSMMQGSQPVNIAMDPGMSRSYLNITRKFNAALIPLMFCLVSENSTSTNSWGISNYWCPNYFIMKIYKSS